MGAAAIRQLVLPIALPFRLSHTTNRMAVPACFSSHLTLISGGRKYQVLDCPSVFWRCLFVFFRLFSLPFFLDGSKGLLFDISPGISGFRHHSPLFILNGYPNPARSNSAYQFVLCAPIHNSGAIALLHQKSADLFELFTKCLRRRNKGRQFYPAIPAMSSKTHPDAMARWTFAVFRFWPQCQ